MCMDHMLWLAVLSLPFKDVLWPFCTGIYLRYLLLLLYKTHPKVLYIPKIERFIHVVKREISGIWVICTTMYRLSTFNEECWTSIQQYISDPWNSWGSLNLDTDLERFTARGHRIGEEKQIVGCLIYKFSSLLSNLHTLSREKSGLKGLGHICTRVNCSCYLICNVHILRLERTLDSLYVSMFLHPVFSVGAHSQRFVKISNIPHMLYCSKFLGYSF